MRLRNRQLRVVAGIALVTVLSACGDVPTRVTTVTPTSVHKTESSVRNVETSSLPVTTLGRVETFEAVRAAEIATARYAIARESNGYRRTYAPTNRSAQAPPAQALRSGSVAGGSSLASVLACIKAHESGNYDEHSHPSGSSGAYQFEPSTWRYWSAKAGYPGWPLAYLAPPAVQDAVTAYTLTHGGAHNWDPRFGNDPCTVGMH